MQDTNKKVTLPRDLRSLPMLELVSSLLNLCDNEAYWLMN